MAAEEEASSSVSTSSSMNLGSYCSGCYHGNTSISQTNLHLTTVFAFFPFHGFAHYSRTAKHGDDTKYHNCTMHFGSWRNLAIFKYGAYSLPGCSRNSVHVRFDKKVKPTKARQWNKMSNS